MDRLRSAGAVLPPLVPAALVAWLAFQAGGFYPDAWAAVGFIAAVALALRVTLIGSPFAGFSAWSAVAAGAFALFAAWTFLSGTWSDAPGRAVVEFGRALAYLLVLVLCASFAPREHRLAWALRWLVLAIAAICVVGLISRLRPDVLEVGGEDLSRLDYPITYWNGLAMLAGVGAILGLHLSASEHEPWPVRVLAAAVPPIAACTVYFTLSRGGIIATAFGLVVYLLLGFSRATPAALLAIVPTTAYALTRAYDADILTTKEFSTPAGIAQGREVVTAIALAVGAALVLRAAGLLLDKGLGRVPGPGRLPVAVRAGIVAGLVVVAVVVAIGAGAPAWGHRQVDTFLSSSPASSGPDERDRLTVFNNNGRVEHWDVALDQWRTDRFKGTGAGTFQNAWNQDRSGNFKVLDAHSLYIEVLGELGVAGLALLVLGIGTVMTGLAWRLRGRGRTANAAVLAAVATWALHAGVDWDWELTAISVWMFGLAGIALARAPGEGRERDMPRLLRIVVALGCLVLALSPALLWRSQTKLFEASAAFKRGDCPTTIDAALDSLGAIGTRAEPWELIAYCNVRLGQPQLAIGAGEAAVRRDSDDWEYHYALALVRGAARKDPRPAAAEALRLNPQQPEAQAAVKAFKTDRPALWERRARRLPLYIN